MKKLLHFICVLCSLSSSLCNEPLVYPSVELVTSIMNILDIECIEILYSEGSRRMFSARIHYIFKEMSMKRMSKSFSIQNYRAIKEMEEQHHSSKCNRPIRLLAGRNQSITPYVEMSRFHSPSVIPVTFLPMRTSIEVFFSNATLPVNLVTIAAQFRAEDFIELYDIYRVYDDSPLKVQVIGNWTPKTGVQTTLTRYHYRNRKFDGKIFRTVSPEIWPYVTFHGFMEDNVTCDGLYPRVWRELESFLNFTSVHYRNDKYGILNIQHNKWSGMIRMVLDKEVDVIVADLTLSSSRIQVLDFITILPVTRSRIYYKRVGKQFTWYVIFLPLSFSVWLAVFGTGTLLAISYFIFAQIYVAYGLDGDERYLHFIDYLFLTIQAAFQQGIGTTHERLAYRTLYIIGYSATMIVFVAYAGSLISVLTQETPIKPFNSIQGLLEGGSYKLIIRNGSSQHEYFLRKKEKDQKNSWRKIIPIRETFYKNYTSVGLGMICSNYKMAVLEKEQIMTLMNPAALGCEILSVDEPFRIVYDGIAIRRGSPYTPFFRYYIQKMKEAGLIQRMLRKVKRKKEEIETTVKPVTIQQVSVIFLFLMIGMIMSMLLLMAEIIYKSKRQQQCRRPQKRAVYLNGVRP